MLHYPHGRNRQPLSVINNLTINGFNRFQVTAVTNASGQKIERPTNPRGQFTRVRAYNGGTLYANTTRAYQLGNLSSVTNHAGNVTTMGYDGFGRLASPATGATIWGRGRRMLG